ncbi:hypothetical protein [Bernardetia sp. MNP-M8]|uniref:hypothetical protein n=1 Tax=Bernardetia sp. MNP-M8 TaxID=3127470 RepID=UPI0030CC7837
MPYPIFSKADINATNSKHGDSNVSEFLSYLSELVEYEYVEHPTALGIIKQVNDKGTESLTDNQAQSLEIVMKEYGQKDCEKCGNDIPWNELIAAIDNGGYCNFCEHQNEQDD